MVKIIRIDRRSAVLTPSSLACLSHMPTINLTSGCAHGCIYCYTRGYSTHPGENKVVLYRNTLDKLKAELARRKKRPYAVYFSPSSDLFQSIPEVLELGYHVLEFLLSQGIGVAFLRKGRIPEKTMELLLTNAGKVRAQIGIITRTSGEEKLAIPVILTFMVDESEAKEVNLALDLILKTEEENISRSQALAHLARFYLTRCKNVL